MHYLAKIGWLLLLMLLLALLFLMPQYMERLCNSLNTSNALNEQLHD